MRSQTVTHSSSLPSYASTRASFSYSSSHITPEDSAGFRIAIRKSTTSCSRMLPEHHTLSKTSGLVCGAEEV